jgi:hypothetical protein
MLSTASLLAIICLEISEVPRLRHSRYVKLKIPCPEFDYKGFTNFVKHYPTEVNRAGDSPRNVSL